jgi:hypothetical protein
MISDFRFEIFRIKWIRRWVRQGARQEKPLKRIPKEYCWGELVHLAEAEVLIRGAEGFA